MPNLTIPQFIPEPGSFPISQASPASLPLTPTYRMPADVQAKLVAFQRSRQGSATTVTFQNSNPDALTNLNAQDTLDELVLSPSSTCASASSASSYSFFSSAATSPGILQTPLDIKSPNIVPKSPPLQQYQTTIGTSGVKIGISSGLPTPKIIPASPTSLSARRNLRFDTSTLFLPSSSGNADPTKPIRSPLAVKSAPVLPSGSYNSFSTTPRMDFSGVRQTSTLLDPLSLSPLGNSNHGAFTEYAKYVNLDTGTLNFDGQATINAYGIEFSSGMAFRISMADLERLEPIGRGNYGTVIRVRHKPTKIIMAMKEIRLELDKAKLQQIIMELDTLNRCAKSEYIVEFYGAFFEEGTVYVCMEYMDGGSLDKIYGSPGEGVDEPYLAIIANSVVMALKELKENHNVIHRDVKPTNILASTNGKIKLCDFGVSGNLVASVAKTNIGCQSYMAPERIRFANSNQNINNHNNNSITYSSQSDIWSLGVTILEIAGGKYPYAEMFDNIFSQLNAIIEGITPSLPAEKFSPEAIDFVKRCLNKNPALRPNYSQLLNHPWLRNRNLENVDMAAFIQQRIAQRAERSLVS